MFHGRLPVEGKKKWNKLIKKFHQTGSLVNIDLKLKEFIFQKPTSLQTEQLFEQTSIQSGGGGVTIIPMFKPFIDIYVLQMFICHHNQHVNNIFTELQEKKKNKLWNRGNVTETILADGGENMHQNASAPSRPRHAQNRSGPLRKTKKTWFTCRRPVHTPCKHQQRTAPSQRTPRSRRLSRR